MGIIYLLLTISLIMALIFLGIFVKMYRSGQFEDDYTPSIRILFDDKPKSTTASGNSKPSNPLKTKS
jgi:cbb3-type cytochrome oxidase maturation protein